MTNVVRRGTIDLLKRYFRTYGCVLLLGPEQVGKTTLAREFVDSRKDYFDLRKQKDRRKFQNFDALISQYKGKTIAIDEAQLMPEIFHALGCALDSTEGNHEKTRFLILGSATISLESLANEHLCGRFDRVYLDPFCLIDLTAVDNFHHQ